MEPPYITKKDVREALDLLADGAGELPMRNPLRALVLIDHILLTHNLYLTRDPRESAVFFLLEQLVTEQLDYYRRMLMLAALPQTDLPSLYAAIGQDYQFENEELRCWSLLYYVYAGPAIHLSLVQFSDAAHLTDRHIRRYRDIAVSKLWRHLERKEIEAVHRYRRLALLRQLPTRNTLKLFGREDALQSAYKRLVSDVHDPVLIVTGAAGVGKTAFVSAFVHRCIEGDFPLHLDQIVWIDKPGTITDIRERLHSQLYLEQCKLPLQQYLNYFRVLIIIDDIRLLMGDMGEIQSLIAGMGPAWVILINRDTVYLEGRPSFLHLNNLDRANSIYFIHELLANDRSLVDAERESLADYVYSLTNGNPYLIEIAVQRVISGDLEIALEAVSNPGFNHLFVGMTSAEKTMLLRLAMCPPGNVQIGELRSIWGEKLDIDGLATLVRERIVPTVSGSPLIFNINETVTSAARELIERDNGVGDVVTQIIREVGFASHGSRDMVDFQVRFVLYVTGQSWLPISSEQLEAWALALRSTPAAQTPDWHLLLTRYIGRVPLGKRHPNLYISLAAYHLKRGEWPQVISLTQDAIQNAGISGSFTDQIEALRLHGKAQRASGQYQSAFHAFSHALAICDHPDRREHEPHIRLEIAELALELGDSEMAEEQIRGLPARIEILIIQGEIALLRANYAGCRQMMEQALPLGHLDRHLLGRIHDLVARSHDQQGAYEKAGIHYRIAVAYLAQTSDQIALGRVKTNLGACYVRQGKAAAAMEWLNAGLKHLSLAQDRLGLEIVRFNLSLLGNPPDNSMFQ